MIAAFFTNAQVFVIIVLAMFLGLFFIYLATRLITSAYFRSKMEFIRKEFTHKQ